MAAPLQLDTATRLMHSHIIGAGENGIAHLRQTNGTLLA
jgi:hypothetical protein